MKVFQSYDYKCTATFFYGSQCTAVVLLHLWVSVDTGQMNTSQHGVVSLHVYMCVHTTNTRHKYSVAVYVDAI